MEFDLIITERATEEIQNATDYYDEISPNLGTRFLIELSEVYKKLSINPQFYSFISGTFRSNIRDTKLKSFPYLVIYEIRESSVMVISVQHTHRKPMFL